MTESHEKDTTGEPKEKPFAPGKTTLGEAAIRAIQGLTRVGVGASEALKDTSGLLRIGDPEEAVRYWRLQQNFDTCAPATQRGIIHKRTGADIREQDLVVEALQKGWYHERGTLSADVGRLLEAHGVVTRRWERADPKILRNELEQGHDVIACVDLGLLHDDPFDVGAGHVVWVTGAEIDRPSDTIRYLFINDSGDPNDGGKRVAFDSFRNAWGAVRNPLVAAVGSAPVTDRGEEGRRN